MRLIGWPRVRASGNCSPKGWRRNGWTKAWKNARAGRDCANLIKHWPKRKKLHHPLLRTASPPRNARRDGSHTGTGTGSHIETLSPVYLDCVSCSSICNSALMKGMGAPSSVAQQSVFDVSFPGALDSCGRRFQRRSAVRTVESSYRRRGRDTWRTVEWSVVVKSMPLCGANSCLRSS